jgi:hypothetical protein
MIILKCLRNNFIVIESTIAQSFNIFICKNLNLETEDFTTLISVYSYLKYAEGMDPWSIKTYIGSS